MDCLLIAFPDPDGVKHDLAIRTTLESKSRSELILFVDDGDRLVFVGFAVAVDANGDLTLPIFDDQVGPFPELHTRLRLGERWAIWQFDLMASSFEVSEADHMVADLKTGSTGCEFVLYKFVPQVTDKPFRDPIEVDDRFQSEMMIAFEHPHRLFFRFEFR